MNEKITKEYWVKGCVNTLISFLAYAQGMEELVEKKTPEEWNKEYVNFCQKYF